MTVRVTPTEQRDTETPANGPICVTVQPSGPTAGIPCWCSESCVYGSRGGGGGL